MRTGLIIFILWFCSLCRFSLLAQVKIEKNGYDFSYLDRKIAGWVDSGYYKGASVIVVKDDRVIHKHYFGNYGPETVAYIASAGKWLSAATIAAVVDEGKLSWDDKVSKWLPEFKDQKGEATLRQLFSHTAGYPDYQPAGRRADNYQTLKESISHIVDLPADTLAGAKFKYGGLAMQVAGRMAEIATGKDWETIFQEKIAGPLGMKLTHFTPVSDVGGQNPMLGGGARGGLDDYAHFLSMIMHKGVYQGKRVLSLKAIREMQADQVGKAEMNDPYVANTRASVRTDVYGLGEWREEVDADGNATLISSPSWAGAYPWIDKKNNVYGFMLARVAEMKNGFNSFLGSPVLPLLVRDVLARANLKNTRHGYIKTSDGATLYYEETGKGEPLILLHGHSFDCTEWDPQFFALAKKYRVIRYDLRGYGWSSMPSESQKALHADDLKSLMDQLHIARAHIVGLSLGGFIVTDFLTLYPGRLLSATMASGDIFDVPGPSKPWTNSEAVAQREKIKIWQARGVQKSKQEWFNALTKRGGKNIESLRVPVWNMIYKWEAWQPQHLEPRFLLGNEAESRLISQKIDVPVMVLTGEFDANHPDKLLTILPGAKQVIVPHAGHVSNLENPNGFNQKILDFLNTIKLKKDEKN
ncbi:CubicO group peptidase, beta-lactamase class C family [Mucilaginibacter gossypiicola]|uniref:CubicO group peptidase, beta-lactamase class C family n=1 Tax=Mucilaginibacter gossypiicola TaxID=551995 RepID=A0A1H8LP50_9SPHI|nr:alpha/beta fold hydrolase [Mucilaginibacter gossypiicola]SEO06897.1 CubicO group peptidase, beta-lactamase class C family [Mucilaginibacter gossypiicola]